MTLRIGYKASAEQFGPRDLVEFTVRAEQAGLDSVWVSDHFLPWRHNGGHAICTSGKGMDLYTDKLMPAVADGVAAAGRDAADVDRMIEVKLSYDRDQVRARENTRFWAPLSLSAEQKHSVGSAEEMERLADQLPLDQVTRRWIVADDPDEAVKQIEPYVDAGLTHLVVHGPGHDQERFLDQFAEDVLPRLRALRGGRHVMS